MRDNDKYKWMQDCAEEIARQRSGDETLMRMLEYICSFAVLIIAVGVLVFGCADAVVRTAENQEQYYSMPVSMTYSRPAAYRKASPTNDQMEAYHHLMQIQEVRR